MTANDIKNLVLQVLEDYKVSEVVSMDVRDKTTVTDWILIATGTSSRHVKTLAANVVNKAKDSNIAPIGVEGEQNGEWILVDLGDVLLHVMQAAVRDYYNIEKLWSVDNEPVASN